MLTKTFEPKLHQWWRKTTMYNCILKKCSKLEAAFIYISEAILVIEVILQQGEAFL